jgi:hypothetical protein
MLRGSNFHCQRLALHPRGSEEVAVLVRIDRAIDQPTALPNKTQLWEVGELAKLFIRLDRPPPATKRTNGAAESRPAVEPQGAV